MQAYAIPINNAESIAKQIEAGQGSSTVHIGATAFLGIESDGSSSGSGSGVAPATPAASAVRRRSGFGGFGDGSGFGGPGDGSGTAAAPTAAAPARRDHRRRLSGSPAASAA